jgi:L-rhamnose mutarotase
MSTHHGQIVGLRPEKREEYLRLHRAVWPEVEQMIRACGIRDYRIYLHGDVLFSTFEYVGDDYAADMARMAADPATQRWWELTGPCQVALDADGSPWSEADEVWRLS